MPSTKKTAKSATVSSAAKPASAAKSAAPKTAVVVPAEPAGSKGRIYLIDAMSFIFRAYHAMARQRPMSTKTGIPTSATFVFVNMLRKLRADFSPEYLAAVFDVSAPTFRDQQATEITSLRKFDSKTQTYVDHAYDGYKANRSAMPDDLAQQVPYIRRALDAYRIPILEMPGFEADDVIGTLAHKAADAGYSVFVVSSDKDMMQLVSDRICVLNPPKDNLICDAAKVEEILGVPPERVVDVMALRGDSIDNIPGAPGIGDKGSVELIQRFGSVEGALDHADEVERKTYRESLQNNRNAILVSKKLVTIDRNVAVDFDPEKMKAQEPDAAGARALFTELEFNTLVQDFLSESIELGETDYRDAKSAADVKAVIATASKPGKTLAIALESLGAAGVSTETEEAEEPESEQLSLTAAAPITVSAATQRVAISVEEGKALAVTLDDSPTATPLKEALANEKVAKTIHDLKSATHTLRGQGIAIAGVKHDPLLYAYLLDPTYSTYALPLVAFRKFNLKMGPSTTEAADITLRLADKLSEEVDKAELRKVYDDIDLPLVPVLARMEETGVKLDCDVLADMSRRLENDIGMKAREIYGKCGFEFNINSPKQLGDVLFNKLNLPKPIKYGKGKTISTAVDVLEGLASEHDVPKMVLDYRQLSKLKSTYVDALPALLNSCTKRLHTTFNMAGSATGRLSSVNPNLQNIPIRTELGREIRAAFIAEPGFVLLAADYSQIELRLLAHYSGDKLLIEAYNSGQDIHTLTASQVFGVPPLMVNAEHRRRAKAVNFGIVYGLSAFGLSQQIGIDTKEAKRFIDAYFEKYSGVREFIELTLDEARREQKVKTLFGRVRPIPDIHSKNFNLRGFAERTAVNTPLQGTAADLIKLAMIRIDADLRERGLRSRMLLQVHDELVFEVAEDEIDTMRRLVTERMEQVHELKVPLKVEVGVGPNWRDLE
ncbi:MAG TPA: DNA polymerase I [Verrucomicrobiae bacterium]|nr:DNA polymerase I [Verrucomicrobiae bacterium]